ncbi:MAG: hypothetical protein MUF87_18250 [Anaerolineae bacterium]|jgi:hypothetical protein|nr:hypothetical protein [Anaerolineae bacterium]
MNLDEIKKQTLALLRQHLSDPRYDLDEEADDLTAPSSSTPTAPGLNPFELSPDFIARHTIFEQVLNSYDHLSPDEQAELEAWFMQLLTEHPDSTENLSIFAINDPEDDLDDDL